MAFWASVKDSRSPAMVQTYLERFPSGMFVGLARVLIERLRSEAEQKSIVEAREADLRKAEDVRWLAEQQCAESERKAAEARRGDELRKAQEEARQAQEALVAAEKEREAALKSAEAARKAQQDAAKAVEATTQQSRVASLQGTEHARLPPSDAEREKLARDLQTELKRVGCDPGRGSSRGKQTADPNEPIPTKLFGSETGKAKLSNSK